VRPQTLRMKYITDYFDHATLQHRAPAEIGDMLLTNLFSPPAIPMTIAMGLALAGFWRSRFHASRAPSRTDASPESQGSGSAAAVTSAWARTLGSPESTAIYRLIFFVTLLTAALWPFHPWDLRYRYSLYLHALSAVAAVRIAADLLQLAAWRGTSLLAGARFAMAAFVLLATWHVAGFERRHRDALPDALEYLRGLALPPGSVAVQANSCPVLRYLSEYGPFAGDPRLATLFRCNTTDALEPLDGSTRYFISVLGPSLVPEGATVQDPSLPPNLYKVRVTQAAL
jgi:hypothetical protein